MASVRLKILRIVDESRPGFAEGVLVDCSGASHYFIDKIPVIVSCDWNIVPPCNGEARCVIVEEKAGTFVIDTSLPDDIESTDGEHIFEVNKEQVIV